MKVWSKPAVREQEVGLEVTSYLPAAAAGVPGAACFFGIPTPPVIPEAAQAAIRDLAGAGAEIPALASMRSIAPP